jgi:hypothetical protein
MFLCCSNTANFNTAQTYVSYVPMWLNNTLKNYVSYVPMWLIILIHKICLCGSSKKIPDLTQGLFSYSTVNPVF